MAKDRLLISNIIGKQLWKKKSKKGRKKYPYRKTQLAIFITECNELELSTCGGYKNTEK